MPIAVERKSFHPLVRAVVLDDDSAVLDFFHLARDRRVNVGVEERVRRRDALPALYDVARLHAQLARRTDVLRQRDRHDGRRRHLFDRRVPRELLALGPADAAGRMDSSEKPLEHNITPTKIRIKQTQNQRAPSCCFAFVFILPCFIFDTPAKNPVVSFL